MKLCSIVILLVLQSLAFLEAIHIKHLKFSHRHRRLKHQNTLKQGPPATPSNNGTQTYSTTSTVTKTQVVTKEEKYDWRVNENGEIPIFLKYLKSDAYNRKKVFEELKTRKAQAKVYKREKLIVGGKMYALKNHLFSIGYSRHLFTKFFNRFLLKTFKQEVDESYGFFQEQSRDRQNLISQTDLEYGLPKSHWMMEDSPSTESKTYTKVFDLDEKGGLDKMEFSFLEVKLMGKYPGHFECVVCMKSVRKEIISMFQIADCNEDGTLTSEEFFEFINKVTDFKDGEDEEEKPVPIWTNDFILKVDPTGSGMITLEEFMEGVLRGLHEFSFLPGYLSFR